MNTITLLLMIAILLLTLIIYFIRKDDKKIKTAKRTAKLEEIAQWASEVSVTKGPLDGGYVRYVSEETMSKMETQLKIAGYETGIITERIKR